MAQSNLMVHFLLLLIAVCIVSGNDQAPKCYGELGCFPTYDPWTSIYRPAFPAPQSPEECGTFLIYFNREKGKSIEDGFKITLHPEISMEESGYDPKRSKTYFIAHGFINSGNQSWMSEMKDALLYKEDANVFIVDWGKGAEIINYFQAASNTRVVGAELGRFLRYLMKTYNLNPRNVHLIGHSLGAQIASYAAKIVHGIGRVTGLDPAQPGFEGTPVIVRIDKSDAEFVDAFHTNCRPTIPTLGFGMIETVGHVDIYFNGGLDQPGCYTPDGVPYASLKDLATVPVKVLGKWVSCSHLKAFQYFTASINSKCKIWARKEGKLRSMINAVSFGELEPITAAIIKCSRSTCTAAGLDTPKYAARGMFAATTLRNAPYCDADIDPDYDKKILAQINDGEEKEEEHKSGIPADITIEELAGTVESIEKDVNDAIEAIDRIIADRVGSTKKGISGGVETAEKGITSGVETAENGITSGVETAENGITSGVETAKKGITSGAVKETIENAGSVISKISLPKLSGGAESAKTEQGGPSEIKE